MRAKFTTDSVGRVTVEYDDEYTGERVERTFTCPIDGGYVIELLPNGSTTQPCDGLARTGNTLRCSSRGMLGGMIRQEFRRMRNTIRRSF